MAEMRLQKYLAEAGVASRRASEELILEGRVSVNGIAVRTLGSKVDPENSTVAVDGETIKRKESKTYLAFYKPRGVLSTMSDPDNRPCLGDYFKDFGQRLFHIGRLDKESEGLILLSNDGQLTHRATHPSYGLTKRYVVEIEGSLNKADESKLLSGIELEDGLAKADSLVKIRQTKVESTWYEVTIHEGRYHIVRRLFETLEHPVMQLIRTDFGNIGVGELKPGRYRHLNSAEIEKLFNNLSIN